MPVIVSLLSPLARNFPGRKYKNYPIEIRLNDDEEFESAGGGAVKVKSGAEDALEKTRERTLANREKANDKKMEVDLFDVGVLCVREGDEDDEEDGLMLPATEQAMKRKPTAGRGRKNNAVQNLPTRVSKRPRVESTRVKDANIFDFEKKSNEIEEIDDSSSDSDGDGEVTTDFFLANEETKEEVSERSER